MTADRLREAAGWLQSEADWVRTLGLSWQREAAMAALLRAVADEAEVCWCDRLDHDAEQMLYRFGPGDYYMGQRMGLMTSASDVRRAINKALGVSE